MSTMLLESASVSSVCFSVDVDEAAEAADDDDDDDDEGVAKD